MHRLSKQARVILGLLDSSGSHKATTMIMELGRVAGQGKCFNRQVFFKILFIFIFNFVFSYYHREGQDDTVHLKILDNKEN